ncbi:MAG: hypothetical protein M3Y86_10675 [Verrucomicrobiota bacterium]|nr:hypothetical protein [Verrucomicrobiota bacterium]
MHTLAAAANLALVMKPNESLPATRTSTISGEALIGIGMTLTMLGFMFLLLGWAQHMRQVKESSVILLAIGAIMFVSGIITALTGSKRRRS